MLTRQILRKLTLNLKKQYSLHELYFKWMLYLTEKLEIGHSFERMMEAFLQRSVFLFQSNKCKLSKSVTTSHKALFLKWIAHHLHLRHIHMYHFAQTKLFELCFICPKLIIQQLFTTSTHCSSETFRTYGNYLTIWELGKRWQALKCPKPKGPITAFIFSKLPDKNILILLFKVRVPITFIERQVNPELLPLSISQNFQQLTSQQSWYPINTQNQEESARHSPTFNCIF